MNICYCNYGGPGSHKKVDSCLYPVCEQEIPGMDKFDSGATRTAEPLEDYEGFLSPLVLEQFARYMAKHRKKEDGEIRSSDNWQRGMSKTRYMRSMWRHFHELWKRWRHRKDRASLVDPLCALFFNVQGMLLEVLISIGKADRPIIRSDDNVPKQQ